MEEQGAEIAEHSISQSDLFKHSLLEQSRHVNLAGFIICVYSHVFGKALMARRRAQISLLHWFYPVARALQ